MTRAIFNSEGKPPLSNDIFMIYQCAVSLRCSSYCLHLTHCGLVTPCSDRDRGQHWLNVPSGNKPLPEPTLTYHHLGPAMFMWGQFCLRYHSHQSLKVAWNYFLKILLKSPGCQWVNSFGPKRCTVATSQHECQLSLKRSVHVPWLVSTGSFMRSRELDHTLQKRCRFINT